MSKEEIKTKLEELREKEQEMTDEQGYWGSQELLDVISMLEELLGDEK